MRHVSRVAGRALVPLAALLLAACAGRARPLARPTVPVRDEGVSAAVVVPAAISEADAAYLRDRLLLVPVANVRARALRSTFDDPRDGGARAHRALDILAPRGTPVLAADDGRVWTVRSNSLGGLTVYTTDPADRFVFYYAHLDQYRAGLVDGMPLLKGDTLGFVGTTGNAPPETPHLHFQVARIGADHHWWTGAPIDPTPFLRDAEVALAGRDRATQAVTAANRDLPNVIVVPAIRRRATPTVPADSSTDSSSSRRSTPRGPR